MNQAHITHLLIEYLDGTLPPPQMERIKSHLIFCLNCRRHLAETEHNIGLLKSTPPAPPPKGLEGKIISKLTSLAAGEGASSSASAVTKPKFEEAPIEEATAPPSPPSWLLSYKGLGLAVACLVLVVAIKNIPTESIPGFTKIFAKQEKAPAESPDFFSEKKAPMALAKSQEAPAGENQEAVKEEAVPAPVTNSVVGGNIPAPVAIPEQANITRGRASLRRAAREEEIESGELKQQAMGREETKFFKAKQESLSGADQVTGAVMGPPFQELEGQMSGINQPMELVITKSREWKKIWKNHTEIKTPPDPLPEVNFETSEIIAIFSGEKPTGGYSLKIVKIVDSSWEGVPARIVYYRLSEPPAGVVKTMALTQPFRMKVVPRFQGRTFFRKIR
ncbi:MAG: protease complex subunit PrcB family protein [Elusimicrobia bacterium]|nr:protease complex subunit PrcB family protein [Candidatus Obscuribacterium magneticum]